MCAPNSARRRRLPIRSRNRVDSRNTPRAGCVAASCATPFDPWHRRHVLGTDASTCPTRWWQLAWMMTPLPGRDYCLKPEPGSIPLGQCDSVASQLVGHETARRLSLTLQEHPKESPRRPPVPTGLNEDVDHVPVLGNRAPEILALTVDRHEDFVQEPCVSESTLSSLQPPSVVGAELPAPLPNGLVRHEALSS